MAMPGQSFKLTGATAPEKVVPLNFESATDDYESAGYETRASRAAGARARQVKLRDDWAGSAPR